MLSVIIPALNEVYLQQTISNVLENARGEIEIIAVLDGYWPDPPIEDHPSVRLIHNTVPRGQRHSINDACRIAVLLVAVDGSLQELAEGLATTQGEDPHVLGRTREHRVQGSGIRRPVDRASCAHHDREGRSGNAAQDGTL